MHRADRGAALLEALLALTILGTVGVALAMEVRQTYTTTRHVREAEGRVLEASGFLDAVALWTVEDLDRRLGDRRNGPWRMEIQRIMPGLYDVTVRDSSGDRTLVATTLYRRPDGSEP